MYKWEIFSRDFPRKKGYKGRDEAGTKFSYGKKVLVIGLYRVAVGAAGRQPALQGGGAGELPLAPTSARESRWLYFPGGIIHL